MMGNEDRRVIGSYPDYADAERAVEHLAERGFPVERVEIVGHDLRLVEQVSGRVGYRQAILRGAGSGALVGVLIGWIFGLLNWVDPVLASLWLAFDGMVFGAIVGAVFGGVSHWAQHGKHDFDSVQVMLPSRYEVVADADVADKAVALLEQTSPTTRGAQQSGV